MLVRAGVVGAALALAVLVARTDGVTEVASASACPAICAQTDLYGFDPAFQLCSCASATCNCGGECRGTSQGHVVLYSKNSSGVCDSFAKDCSIDACTSGSETTSPPTTSSSPNAGSGSKSNTPATTAAPSGSSHRGTGSKSAGSNSAGTNTTSSDKGLQTWQILLIIASSIAVFLVIVSALLSLYCKVRRDLERSEVNDAHEDHYYYRDEFGMADMTRASGWRPSTSSGHGNGNGNGSSPEYSDKAVLVGSASNAVPISGNRFSQQSFDGARSSEMYQQHPQQRLSHSPSYENVRQSEGRPRQTSIEL